MKVTSVQTISNIKDIQDLQRFLSQIISNITTAINGQITFSENINCSVQSVTFSAASQTVAVKHNLGRVASNYIIAGMDKDVRVFNGTKSNESGILYVQATGAATVTLVIF